MEDQLRKALRLTQAGQLREATRLIQRTLGGTSDAADTTVQTAETISVVAGRRAAPTLPRKRTAAILPGGAQFLNASYAATAGMRNYKLYIPSCYHGQALPLVVMLHGCTQDPDDFAAGTEMNSLAESQGFAVAYPAQARSANPSRCWNWFDAAHQQRDQGEPAVLAGLTRQVVDTYHLDARRVYVAGLSAGGAMAVILGRTYPELYAAVGVHSGLPYSAAHDLPSALAAMQGSGVGSERTNGSAAAATTAAPSMMPTIVFHGDHDTTVHQRNSSAVIADAVAAHRQQAGRGEPAAKLRMQRQRGQVVGGHAYTRSSYRDEDGQVVLEHWLIHGAGHAWSGGSTSGSFTDPSGPPAAAEMLRFFAAHVGCTPR